ncbi:MAG: hypothetical protein GXP25_12500 [Planctomycetes bacterium]|nr:hypothetical protein [Planctomycetota bacterium]
MACRIPIPALLGLFAWRIAIMSTLAEAEPIRISDFLVEKTHLLAGDPLTVSVAADGANFALRHNRNPNDKPLPGWRAHGRSYAFVPSTDFSDLRSHKDADLWHKDNGKQDHDRRHGIFTFIVDTTGWTEGVYSFLLMACTEPGPGPYSYDSRNFEVHVYSKTHRPESVSPNLEIAVNGGRCTREDPAGPIHPGRPNGITVRAVDRAASYRLELIRIQPDGRERRTTGRIEPDAPEAQLDLGVFAVPARYDYEAGALYRTGCRFDLIATDGDTGKRIEKLRLVQTMDENRGTEVLRVGADDREVHPVWKDPKHAKLMDPPILLRLSPEVLSDPNDVQVIYHLRKKGPALRPDRSGPVIAGLLRVTSSGGGPPVFEKAVEVGPQPAAERLEVRGLEEGDYRIEIVPQVEGTADRDGPVIVYRRRKPEVNAVRLSPMAPWAFKRDADRPEITVTDFRKAVLEWSTGLPKDASWQLVDGKDGRVALINTAGNWDRPPVVLRPGLTGHYALFAQAKKGSCHIRLGKQGTVRRIEGYQSCFVDAADLTGEEIAIYPSNVAGAGLRELRLVPVTPESVEQVIGQTSNPPTPMVGIADWGDYFMAPSRRLAEDQFDALLQGHAELGMRCIAWAIGRSWVEYHSTLPNTTRFPCVPLDTAEPQYQRTYGGFAHMTNTYQPLRYVLGHGPAYGLQIEPWLAMQRHYGVKAYGGIFTSKWFKEHPKWRRWGKNASAGSRQEVSYYFPEVRKERVDIFCEVARKAPDGLMVGCCRQPPMLLYHPDMVAAYRKKTGIDPLKLDATNKAEYERWIRWRANFFTETLRELKTRLAPIRAETGRPIPVAVRLPSKGLFYNLAQGLDVETWCRERLVDRIQLHPLEEDREGSGSHDVRPYVELGRRHDIPVYGGLNCITFYNHTAVLKRALSLLDAGVGGIELYESNTYAVVVPDRWLVPLLGRADRLRRFLDESNIEACYPIWSRNADAGFDWHCQRGRWSLYGYAANAL